MTNPHTPTRVPDITNPEVYKMLRDKVAADLKEDRRMQQTYALRELVRMLNPLSWGRRRNPRHKKF